MLAAALFALFLALRSRAQTYSATYLPSNAPAQSEQGQSGTNECGTQSSQDSMCQNLYVNSVTDFCLFAPPTAGADSTIGATEQIEVAWCVQGGYGTRVMPPGTLAGAHFVMAPDYVQVTGVGDFTKMNIPAGDQGGELDPHGADGNGNPIGGLVFSSAFGQLEQMHEWTNFMSATTFCLRACRDSPTAPTMCNHIYDEMGCAWNMPANYDAGVFERCAGDDAQPMGVYGSSTFYQGAGSTPSAHPVPSSSACTTYATVGDSAGAQQGPLQIARAARTVAASVGVSASAATVTSRSRATSSSVPATTTPRATPIAAAIPTPTTSATLLSFSPFPSATEPAALNPKKNAGSQPGTAWGSVVIGGLLVVGLILGF